mmetsp:Transcript_39382/g.62428  ORF Transcript_39382/g.62428 Transcript_39382/m.62428 type:complete len:1007 (+) Transcript_39382:63-3083(+)
MVFAMFASAACEELVVGLIVLCFFILRLVIAKKTRKRQRGQSADGEPTCHLYKVLKAETSAGNPKKVLSSWRDLKAREVTPVQGLQLVLKAMIDVGGTRELEDVLDHIAVHPSLCSSKTFASILEAVAETGQTDIMTELLRKIQKRFDVRPCDEMYKVLLEAYASAGLEAKVEEIVSECESRNATSGHIYCFVVKGFLKNGMTASALKYMLEMQRCGYAVPPFAIARLCRGACENGSVATVVDAAKDAFTLSADDAAWLMKHCHKNDDLDLAMRLEKLVVSRHAEFSQSTYGTLLMICVGHSSPYSFEVFKTVQSFGTPLSKGLCLGLLVKSAECKFLSFAEELVDYLRPRGGMTLPAYSALMKVYACCGQFHKACDLYFQMRDEGLEPDETMYGCLMRFAAECGRTEFSQELAKKVPALDIQNYMSLIRAAGHDKDVHRAFAVLEKMKAAGVCMDMAAYTCVLDVCASAGDMTRAPELLMQMQKISSLDMIAFNTALKGYCNAGDIEKAKACLKEMSAAGIPPNEISYNCLINAAATAGNFKEAWSTIDAMEKSGFPVDEYTIAILLKALKRSSFGRDVAKALDLLDRTKLDVCADEILLNTVLETCIRHREHARLGKIISAFRKSSLQPSAHTYGLLIKACNSIKDVSACCGLWQDLTERRGMVPNDYMLGCMLDALVCHSRVEDALSLLHKWKATIRPNTFMYSTIIKGFTNSNQSHRAMDIYEEMKEMNVEMNTFVFTTLIDSQARIGATDAVADLVQCMEGSGCKPDAVTNSTIVKAYVVKGNLDEAYQVFLKIQSEGLAVDSVYNTMLDGCTRLNRMDIADNVLADMEKYNVKPSNFTLGILVKMYGRRKQLKKAFDVINTLAQKHGLEPNYQVKTCLMCACLSNNDFHKAYEVFDDIKKSGQGVDARTYGALIQSNVRHGNLKEAVRLVKEAYGIGQYRVLLPSQTLEPEPFKEFLRALGKNGETESTVVPLLSELRAAKVPVCSRVIASVLLRHDCLA